ncbi:hypothetical protein MRB53_013374 [Persea americana]|uniref:Uncharacterized protein n=1 Tax=Persea americana TaxID=3435 RepID=A0ACC2K8E6_PERAE|nr:hypothetical protein MRB53_013374 [Persea americana]
MVTVENLRPAFTDIDSLIKGEDFVGYPTGSFLFEHLKHLGLQGEKLKPYSTAEEYEEALSQGSSNGGVSAIVDTIPYIRIFLAKYCNQYTMTQEVYETAGFGFKPNEKKSFPETCSVTCSMSESSPKSRILVLCSSTC